MRGFQFDPIDGLLNKTVFATKPSSENEARGHFMALLTQVRDFINGTVSDEISSINRTVSGINTEVGQVKGSITTTNGEVAKKVAYTDFAETKNINGEVKLPNGIIQKWGEVTLTGLTVGEWSNQTKSFATAFPNSCFNIQVNVVGTGGHAVVETGTIAVNQYEIYIKPEAESITIRYLATGH